MRRFIFPFAFIVSFACLLASCNKSDEETITPDTKSIKFVKQITSSTTDFVAYKYDPEGNVIKYTSQWQNGTGLNRLTQVFEYDGKKLSRSSTETGYASYTYTNNVLAKSDHFAFNGKKISSLIYSFNAAGKLTEVLEQIANSLSDGPEETRITYQYYPNGNLSRLDFAYRKHATEPFIINLTKLFVEYDNKVNTEPDGVAGNFLPGVILMRNNPIKINNLLPNGTIEGYSRYEYSYNEKGYPITRKQFIAVGNTEQLPILLQYVY